MSQSNQIQTQPSSSSHVRFVFHIFFLFLNSVVRNRVKQCLKQFNALLSNNSHRHSSVRHKWDGCRKWSLAMAIQIHQNIRYSKLSSMGKRHSFWITKIWHGFYSLIMEVERLLYYNHRFEHKISPLLKIRLKGRFFEWEKFCPHLGY